MTRTRSLLATLILAAAASSGAVRAADAPASPRTIAITARRFEFEPKEIRLKKGETVKLKVTSADVSHGFFQRALKIDAELAAEKTAEVLVTPQEAGTYTLICDHFCGSGHGNMKMTIVVE
ncbi:MAG: cupredoxin domain-containing protein [Acidobacteriota bacterium]